MCEIILNLNHLPLLVYEVPAIRVNSSKSTYTFTSVIFEVFTNNRTNSTVKNSFQIPVLSINFQLRALM